MQSNLISQMRLGMLTLVAAALLVALLSGTGASMHGQTINSMAIQGERHDGRLLALEIGQRKLDEAKLSERLSRMEYQVESVGWLLKVIIGGVLALVAERIWQVLFIRDRAS